VYYEIGKLCGSRFRALRARAILRAGCVGMECVGCQVSDLDQHLNKCPICFKWICDDCSRRSMGRMFCSKRCADQFFFGDDEE